MFITDVYTDLYLQQQMIYNLSINLTYEISFAVEYKLTNGGLCVNTKTGRIIKPVNKDRCDGYYIRGKFRSKKYLRTKLQKIKKDLPF